jgi:hypothetical protein
MDENRNEIEIKSWEVCVLISMAWDCSNNLGDHQRYKDTYFSAFQELISPATVLYEMK